MRKDNKSSKSNIIKGNDIINRKQPIFRWVHLSDIHFQTKGEGYSTKKIRRELPIYLKKIFKKQQCDAIFITGDFRYAPNGTKPETVIKYVKEIAESLNLSNEKVIIVPGNHDLLRTDDRDNVIDRVRPNYKAGLGIIDNIDLLSLANDFSFYNAIQKNFYNGLDINRRDPKNPEIMKNPHDVIEFGPCSILLLNTALTAGRKGNTVHTQEKKLDLDRDEHRLIIGNSYLDELLHNRNCNKPIIAIGHHGLDMLQDHEKERVSTIFMDNDVKLYLCGHAHTSLSHRFGKGKKPGLEIIDGCLRQEEQVTVAFSVGTLYSNGDVKIAVHKWDNGEQSQFWYENKNDSEVYSKLFNVTKHIEKRQSSRHISNTDFSIYLDGSRGIGPKAVFGRKYVWKNNKTDIRFESITHNQSLYFPPKDKKTSYYSISTSIGCQLSTFNSQCVFCEVGLEPKNYYPLTADEIALQCIFMAKYDSNCKNFRNVQYNKREFAFMGQGEPGFSYSMVKRAILLTDLAMDEIKQTVSRYVIYTSGITDFVSDLINDYKTHVFTHHKVCVHFSLNAIDDERDSIMPINKLYPYKDFIEQCKLLYKVTNEKIEVGILLMAKNRTNNDPPKVSSLDIKRFRAILNVLDSEVFSIVLCLVNKMGTQHQLNDDVDDDDDETDTFLNLAEELHFDCRLYGFIDDVSNSGCGQITSQNEKLHPPGESLDHCAEAIEMLKRAKLKIDNEGV